MFQLTNTNFIFKVRKKGKDQESIQSSITPDPGHLTQRLN